MHKTGSYQPKSSRPAYN